MRNLIVLTLLFISISGVARAVPYQKFDQLPDSLQSALKKHSQATLNLYFVSGMQCSGVFVDPEGRALTNLHCIEGCLMEQNAYIEELAHSEPVYIDPKYASNTQFLKKIIPKLSQGLSCRMEIGINGKRNQTVNAEILHIFGPGFLYPRTLVPDLTEKYPAVSFNLKRLGFETSGDLVLFKIPVQPNSGCVQIDFANFESDALTEVVNLAYPAVLRKTNNPQAPLDLIGDRETLLYSFGQASASNDFLQKIFSDASKDLISTILPPGTFLSSTDAESGASGSPLFSNEGKVIGITRATFNYSQTEYAPWSTQGISLSFHKQKLSELLPLNRLCP